MNEMSAALLDAVDRDGFAVTSAPVLTTRECRELRDAWDDMARYRSTVDMSRQRFGEGVYRYFRYPLPLTVAALREATYEALAPLASRWAERMGQARFPAHFEQFRRRCVEAGQTKATPLVLRYERGDYNCLHQDRYGDVAFPLQLTVALSDHAEYAGGETVFVEQRPRAQSRAHVTRVPLGHAVVFAGGERPVDGARGPRRVRLRHGVATVTSGQRFALGVIFHDAR